MNQNNEAFSIEERHAIAVKAVNRLIANAETKGTLELAETVAVCIRETSLSHVQTLKWLMEQTESVG